MTQHVEHFGPRSSQCEAEICSMGTQQEQSISHQRLWLPHVSGCLCTPPHISQQGAMLQGFLENLFCKHFKFHHLRQKTCGKHNVRQDQNIGGKITRQEYPAAVFASEGIYQPEVITPSHCLKPYSPSKWRDRDHVSSWHRLTLLQICANTLVYKWPDTLLMLTSK